MPEYRVCLKDGVSEVHTLVLPDEKAALDEVVRTAAGLVNELPVSEPGITRHSIEVAETSGQPLLRIVIECTRTL